MIDLDVFHSVFNESVVMPFDYIAPVVQKILNKKIKEVVANPFVVSDLLDPTKDVRLFLTNIRTIQQYASPDELKAIKEAISTNRLRKKGKKFYIRCSPPKFCKQYRIAFMNYANGRLENVQIRNLFCKSWTCPICCKNKAISVKYMLREVILMNNLGYFLTLTLDPSKIPDEYLSPWRNKTHRYITKLFNHFITVLKRKTFTYFDKKNNSWRKYKNKDEELILRYIWVIEFQKNGNAHLHILLNQYIPVDVIREIWTHVGGGHIMRIDNVRSLIGISLYLTDYIVKGLKNEEIEQTNQSEVHDADIFPVPPNKSELIGFRYYERRYSISKSCLRVKKPILGNIDKSIEIRRYLQEHGLEWITNCLYNPMTVDININFKTSTNE